MKKIYEGKTAKCPECGNKYLVQTGYCVTCKKKVKEGNKQEENFEKLSEDHVTTWREFAKNPLPKEIGEFELKYFDSSFQKGIAERTDLKDGILHLYINRSNYVRVQPSPNDKVTLYEDFGYGFKVQIGVAGVLYCNYRS